MVLIHFKMLTIPSSFNSNLPSVFRNILPALASYQILESYQLCMIKSCLKQKKQQMSLCMRKPTIWVSDQVDTNRAVQSQKIARSLKFQMKEEEGLYYPCSEKKGADQLRGYREAGLRLCFRIMQIAGFLMQSALQLPRSWSAPLFLHMQIVGFLMQRLK